MDCNIIDFGAIGDGVHSCTNAFHKAVEKCSAAGGGHILIPSGKFLSGTIRLFSNVFLRLSPGAIILADKDFSLFEGTKRGCSWQTARDRMANESLSPTPCKALVVAENAENCGIIGEGSLDGQRGKVQDPDGLCGNLFLVVFANCKQVEVGGVTLRNPGMFTVYMLGCSYVQIHHLRIFSADTVCGDGLDFDGGSHVTISDCILHTGDDGIGLKTLTPNEPCEDFVITNCHIETNGCGAIRIGPESAADMRRITISNCIFLKCNDGFKLQVCEQVVFEDFTFSNIIMDHVVRPFFLTVNHYAFSIKSKSLRPRNGTMRRIAFSNIQANMERRENHYCEPCSFICGLFDSIIEDISFTNVSLLAPGGEDFPVQINRLELLDYTQCYPEEFKNFEPFPASHIYIKNAKRIFMQGCRFDCDKTDKRYALVAENVDELQLNSLFVNNTSGLLQHIQCKCIAGNFHSSSIQAFSAVAANEWHSARQDAIKLDIAMEEVARLYDTISESALEKQYIIIEDSREVRINIDKPDGKQCFLLCTAVVGSWQLLINDENAGYWHMPSCYNFSTPWILDITSFLNKELNILVLQPKEKRSVLPKQNIVFKLCDK